MAEDSRESSLEAVAGRPKQHPGMKAAAGAAFLFTTGQTAVIPFLQSRRDELGCDALCQGGMMSMKATLGLIGAVLFGRASDRLGRRPMLWVSAAGVLTSFSIKAGTDSLEGLWYGTAVAALTNQLFGIMKALFCDYVDECGEATEAERADVAGKLGMTMGLALLVGPAISAMLGCTYKQALALGAGLIFISCLALCRLPAPRQAPRASKDNQSGTSPVDHLLSFFRLPVLKLPGAQAIIAVRLLMALAFHVYIPAYQVSVRKRFSFGPRDYAMQMGIIGLSYALSQGVIARPLINACGAKSARLLMACMAVLGMLRFPALTTSSAYIMHTLSIFMVIALGVANTVITAAAYSLADADQVGGFIGILEGVEQCGGILGPTLGGLITRLAFEHATVAAVMSMYFAAFLVVFFFFTRHVYQASALRPKGAAAEAAMGEGKKDN